MAAPVPAPHYTVTFVNNSAFPVQVKFEAPPRVLAGSPTGSPVVEDVVIGNCSDVSGNRKTTATVGAGKTCASTVWIQAGVYLSTIENATGSDKTFKFNSTPEGGSYSNANATYKTIAQVGGDGTVGPISVTDTLSSDLTAQITANYVMNGLLPVPSAYTFTICDGGGDCSSQKFECAMSSGTCSRTANGTYETQDACQDACKIDVKTYDCLQIGGYGDPVCTKVAGGRYNNEDCTDAMQLYGCPVENHMEYVCKDGGCIPLSARLQEANHGSGSLLGFGPGPGPGPAGSSGAMTNTDLVYTSIEECLNNCGARRPAAKRPSGAGGTPGAGGNNNPRGPGGGGGNAFGPFAQPPAKKNNIVLYIIIAVAGLLLLMVIAYFIHRHTVQMKNLATTTPTTTPSPTNKVR